MTTGKTDHAMLITFVVGVVGIIYFLTSIFLLGSDPMLTGVPPSYLSWMIMERLILIGIVIIILILITYILMRQKNFEELHEKEHPKAKPWRSEKGMMEDIKRYYRDMGALKIVLKDGVIDAETYNQRKRYLQGMVEERKKQLEKLKKGEN